MAAALAAMPHIPDKQSGLMDNFLAYFDKIRLNQNFLPDVFLFLFHSLYLLFSFELLPVLTTKTYRVSSESSHRFRP